MDLPQRPLTPTHPKQTIGLQLTGATRAAFLLQSTAILTPLLASLFGERPGVNVWVGCLVALVGTLLIAEDEVEMEAGEEAAVEEAAGEGVLGGTTAGIGELGTCARCVGVL